MALFDAGFEAFVADDFDAFLAPRRSSNRFNLARQQVRSRLTALLQDVVGAVPEGVEFVATFDHPHVRNGKAVAWQEVALCRDAPRRAALQARDAALEAEHPEDSHLRVGLRLDDAAICFFVSLPAGATYDRAALVDPNEAAPTAQALALWALGTTAGTWTSVVHGVVVAQDDEVPNAAAPDVTALLPGGSSVRLQQTISRDDAIAMGADVVATLRGWWQSVWPVAQAAIAAVTPSDEVAPPAELAAPSAAPADADPVIRADFEPTPSSRPDLPSLPVARPRTPPMRDPNDPPLRAAPRPLPIPRSAAGQPAVERPRIAAPGSKTPDPADVAAQQALEILRQSARPAAPPRPAERPSSERTSSARGPSDRGPAQRGAPERGPRGPHAGSDSRNDGAGRHEGAGRKEGAGRNDGRDRADGPGRRPEGSAQRNEHRGGGGRPYELRPEIAAPAKGELKVGSAVLIRSGLLNGREGTVLKLSGRDARIAVGALEVTLAIGDFVPA